MAPRQGHFLFRVYHRAMDVDKGIMRTIDAFYRLAGGWLFKVWIVAMLGGIVPALAGNEYWWIGLGIGVVILPIVGFHLVRIERDELAEKLDPGSISEVLDPLIAEGAKIRIDGKVFLSDASVDNWVENSALEWTWRTHAILQEVIPKAAPNFKTLHNVIATLPAGYTPHNNRHRLHLRMLTQRTDYLKGLI